MGNKLSRGLCGGKQTRPADPSASRLRLPQQPRGGPRLKPAIKRKDGKNSSFSLSFSISLSLSLCLSLSVTPPSAVIGCSQPTSKTLRTSLDPPLGERRCLSGRCCWSTKTAEVGCTVCASPPQETAWPGLATTAALAWPTPHKEKSELGLCLLLSLMATSCTD